MSSSLLFDIEYYDIKEREWKAIEEREIDIFHCHPLREFLFDCKTGYDHILEDINEQTKSALGIDSFRKILYLSQLQNLILEVQEEEKKYHNDDTESIIEAIHFLKYFVRYFLNKIDIFYYENERVRFIFYRD